jgi:hypothetical protein
MMPTKTEAQRADKYIELYKRVLRTENQMRAIIDKVENPLTFSTQVEHHIRTDKSIEAGRTKQAESNDAMMIFRLRTFEAQRKAHHKSKNKSKRT